MTHDLFSVQLLSIMLVVWQLTATLHNSPHFIDIWLIILIHLNLAVWMRVNHTNVLIGVTVSRSRCFLGGPGRSKKRDHAAEHPQKTLDEPAPGRARPSSPPRTHRPHPTRSLINKCRLLTDNEIDTVICLILGHCMRLKKFQINQTLQVKSVCQKKKKYI